MMTAVTCGQNENIEMPPPLKPFATQSAHPAGAVGPECGTNTCPPTGSTATECALLPVLRVAAIVRVAASTTNKVGLQGLVAEHPPPPSLTPDACQRLAPT